MLEQLIAGRPPEYFLVLRIMVGARGHMAELPSLSGPNCIFHKLVLNSGAWAVAYTLMNNVCRI